MDILIKVAQLFLAFTLLVGLHEFGHFLMARIFKIRVEKFYIFFDPWFSLFKFQYKDTEYGLGWLPLGGYVKISGMIDESMDTEQLKQPVQPWEFRSKPAWQRFMVMVAGVIMNILLALVIYCGISYVWGDRYLSNHDAEWGYLFNERAKSFGFEDGDRIVSIDGEQIDQMNDITTSLLITDKGRSVVVNRAGREVVIDLSLEELIDMRRREEYAGFCTPIIPFKIDSVVSEGAQRAGLQAGDRIIALGELQSTDAPTLSAELRKIKGDTARLTLVRGERELQLAVPVDTAGMIGVQLAPFPVRTRHYTLLESIPAGIERCGRVISSYWEQLKLIVQPKTKMYEELGGFIAIGNIFPSEWDWLRFWSMTAFLSVMLAVLNILPIPGLDGGHALFTLWEMLTGRKASDKFLEIMQYIGFALLLALVIYANGNDIYRLFTK